jgi:transposase
MNGELVEQTTADSEGGRRPTGESAEREAVEMVEPATKRRRLTVAYKIRVVEAVNALKADGHHGSIGGFLRKEGLYYSTVRKWNVQYEQGVLTGRQNESQARLKALQGENQRLKRKLEHVERKLKKTEAIVEIQKKLSAILSLEQTSRNGTDGEN